MTNETNKKEYYLPSTESLINVIGKMRNTAQQLMEKSAAKASTDAERAEVDALKQLIAATYAIVDLCKDYDAEIQKLHKELDSISSMADDIIDLLK